MSNSSPINLPEMRDAVSKGPQGNSSGDTTYKVAVTISGATGAADGANGTYHQNSGVLNEKPFYQQISTDKNTLTQMHISYDVAGTNRWVVTNGLIIPAETRVGYIAGIDCPSQSTNCDFSTLSEKKNWYLLDNGGNKDASSHDTKDMVAYVTSSSAPVSAAASTAAVVVEPPTDFNMKQRIAQVKNNHTNVEAEYKKLTSASTDADRTTFDDLLTKAVTELTTAQQLLGAYKRNKILDDVIKNINISKDSEQDGGRGSSSSSTSKKNRKSYKSYHPGIGKTRKHHSHSEPKRVSFIHQA